MNYRGEDQGIEAEPLHPGSRGTPLHDEPALTGPRAQDAEDAAEHSVWDEPHLRGAASPPPGAVTYAAWYQAQLARTSVFRSWLVVLGLALVGGPFAVLSVFFSADAGTAAGLLAVVFVGPIMEELLKIGATAIALERRPYLFRSGVQLAFAAAVSGLGFAVIENLLYLNLYIEEPSSEIVVWRWTVCTALHTGCTLISALGLARVLSHSRRTLSRPAIFDAYPLVFTAIAVHGTYNFLATVMEAVLAPF